jgi:hypothetical protein
MNRKGFAPLIVVGIIAVLVVIGAVGYFAWKGFVFIPVSSVNLGVPTTQTNPQAATPVSTASSSISQSQVQRVVLAQISYIPSSTLFTVSTTTVSVSDMFNASDMASYSADCGTNKSESYFQKLLSGFPVDEKAIEYDFNYIGANDNGTFSVEVLPNIFGYKTLGGFQNDFNRCDAEDSYYPIALNNSYLLFEGGCGGGAPDGCSPVRYFVEPTIRLEGDASSAQSVNGTFSGSIQQTATTPKVQSIIYVADSLNNRIEEFNTSGTYLSQFGSTGSGNGQFNVPYGIAADSSGDIYVVDSNNNRVEKFSSDGTYLAQFGSAGAKAGQFTGPTEMAIDKNGNLLVVDASRISVEKFSPNGAFLTQFIFPYGNGNGAGRFISLWGIAIAPNGNLYFPNNPYVDEFSPNGVYLSQFGSYGSGAGQFRNTQHVAIDANGDIYASDINRVEKFSPSGVFISQFGSQGSGNGQFKLINGIAVDGAGNIYVSDEENNRVTIFSSDGTYLSQFGSLGPGDGQFDAPAGIVIH